MQEIAVLILFAGALVYIGSRVWKQMRRKDCGGGCSACGGIDVDAIEKQIRSKDAKGHA
ncbi:MAG TPA: FeoB-associated Cys-rich membrane protein [Bacteroidia bacterium]|jgi:hypothetical protein|nr:FeoB-associated Cys-rich membrane protein [Bacteroidia bacterium]